MSVWFAQELFFCTVSVEACEFVTCEVPDFENATRMIGSRVVLSDKIDFITMSSMFALARFSCSHSTPLTLTSSSSIPSSRTTSQVKLPINKPCEDPQDEVCGPVAKHNIFQQVMSPNVIDNFDYSETYTAIFQNDPVDIDTEPSYSFDAELDDELIRKAP